MDLKTLHQEFKDRCQVEEYTSRLNITESTFYNWQLRKNKEQLEDRSSEPEHKPKATDLDDLIEAIEIIIKHPDWGGKKQDSIY